MAQAKRQIEEVLLKRYDKDEFSVLVQTEILNTIGSIFSIINMVLVALALGVSSLRPSAHRCNPI